MADTDVTALRVAGPEDDAFILGFVERFSDFPLPAGRTRDTVNAGVRADLEAQVRGRPAASHFFIVERAGERAGFIHLVMATDFFGGAPTCHVSDLAVSPGHEGQGLATRMLAHAEAFARERGCARLTLSVVPGNERALRLYRANGFVDDLVKMGKPL